MFPETLGVSLATTYRIVQKLAKVGLVKKDHLDKFTYYKVIKGSPAHDELSALLIGKKTDAFSMFKNRVIEKYSFAKLYEIKDNKDKKIFVVGKGLSELVIKEVSRDVFDKTNVKINSLVLTPEKFDQMKEIGLISQEKEI